MRPAIFIVSFFLITSLAFGQTTKKKKNKDNVRSETNQPSTVDPGASPTYYEPKKTRVKSGLKITYDGERRYYERKELAAKERRKAEKELMKPQYSDPMYFGHKRPPKKRKPGKMKYCRECGLRH